MGHVYADITLRNTVDVILARRNNTPFEKVQKVEVSAMVDSGAMTLTINEAIAQQLALDVLDQIEVTLLEEFEKTKIVSLKDFEALVKK